MINYDHLAGCDRIGAAGQHAVELGLRPEVRDDRLCPPGGGDLQTLQGLDLDWYLSHWRSSSCTGASSGPGEPSALYLGRMNIPRFFLNNLFRYVVK